MPDLLNRASPRAIALLAEALGEAIQTVPAGIPSGHLYAAVMGSISLDLYNAAIADLVRRKLVRNSNYLLTWIGA